MEKWPRSFRYNGRAFVGDRMDVPTARLVFAVAAPSTDHVSYREHDRDRTERGRAMQLRNDGLPPDILAELTAFFRLGLSLASIGTLGPIRPRLADLHILMRLGWRA